MKAKLTAIGEAIFKEAASTTKSHFISRLGISSTHFYDICRGDRRLTWKTAKRLGEITDTPALDWIAMQFNYDLEEEMNFKGVEQSKKKISSVLSTNR